MKMRTEYEGWDVADTFSSQPHFCPPLPHFPSKAMNRGGGSRALQVWVENETEVCFGQLRASFLHHLWPGGLGAPAADEDGSPSAMFCSLLTLRSPSGVGFGNSRIVAGRPSTSTATSLLTQNNTGRGNFSKIRPAEIRKEAMQTASCEGFCLEPGELQVWLGASPGPE